MYIINNEICSRLVCKEHEAMKGKTMSVFLMEEGTIMIELNKDIMLIDSKSGSGGRLLATRLTSTSPCSTKLPQISNPSKAAF